MENLTIDKTPLITQLTLKLRQMIIDGALPAGERIPNEFLLAEELNVSRSSIRSAIQNLERTGYIVKKRGIGTFVVKNPRKVNNLNLNWSVTQVIQSMGAVPGSLDTQVHLLPANEEEAEHLQVDVGEPICVIERVRTADGERVVFSLDKIACKLVQNSSNGSDPIQFLSESLGNSGSVFELASQQMGIKLHHALARVMPLSANAMVYGKSIAARLLVSEQAGILKIEQVEYTSQNEPILDVVEYHLAEPFTFMVYRSY